MPFIEKQDRTEREEIKAKIRPEVIALVRDYARFLESEEWYVIQEVLRKSIEADKDFQRWRADGNEVLAPAQEPKKGQTRKSPGVGNTGDEAAVLQNRVSISASDKDGGRQEFIRPGGPA
ncbi:MAG: hypothetical protein JOZ62_08470 [Acidobacteriaceae bacterium]|nr:hypothetical protein [Acidobacteriaceae bacterium]